MLNVALTKTDFLKLRQLFYTKVDLDEKLDNYPDRTEFNEKFDKVFRTLDKVMGELEIIRDEVTLSASRATVEELEERVDKIEQRLSAAT